MSITSEINRIKTNIANTYIVASNKGATLPEVQNSANLASTIEEIPNSGGIPVNVKRKDVNFFDYDGTLLYSYTLNELQALTELPPLPSHDGLVCQGWNWTLENIKAEEKETDVGAMYITDDGKTRLYIRIASDGRMNVPLCFRQSVTNGVEVDWGDSSGIETFAGSGTTDILPRHQYSAIGDYVITLNPLNGCVLTLGANNSSYCVMGPNSNENKAYKNMLTKVEVGKNITNMGSYTFSECRLLSSITIPKEVTSIGGNVFEDSYFLSNITIPTGVTQISEYSFYYCQSKNIIIPKEVTFIGNYAFKFCWSIASITLPKGIICTNYETFRGCYSLMGITISDGESEIQNSSFYECKSLSNIKFPSSIRTISSASFYNCYSIAYYDFSTHTSIPGLSSTTAFRNIASDCKIIVPDDLYDDWIVATNWSAYASYIVKASEV